MKEWELSRYLIDAKKNIDSILFIKQHVEKISNINLKEKTDKIQMEFYIKLCVILDDVFSGKKKQICEDDAIINSIYVERDKDKAHKDKNYIPHTYESWDDIIKIMKDQIEEVKKICSDKLPKIITLDYVPHDKELFRFLHGLTKEEEDKLNSEKYTIYNNDKNEKTINKKVFNDTEEIKMIKENERTDYAVLFNNGINFYEGIQERQDGCIKANVLFGTNEWCTYTKVMNIIEELRKHGFIDDYAMPISYQKWNNEKYREFLEIINKKEDFNE